MFDCRFTRDEWDGRASQCFYFDIIGTHFFFLEQAHRRAGHVTYTRRIAIANAADKAIAHAEDRKKVCDTCNECSTSLRERGFLQIGLHLPITRSSGAKRERGRGEWHVAFCTTQHGEIRIKSILSRRTRDKCLDNICIFMILRSVSELWRIRETGSEQCGRLTPNSRICENETVENVI